VTQVVAGDLVAYLGPAGTFTETAARILTGAEDESQLYPCADIDEIFREVEAGRCARGVVPIENTLEGSVTATLDALAFDTDLLVHGEMELPVTLVAAVKPGTELPAVTQVHSHPVPLSGCRRWLSTAVPEAERIPAASTARAAELVAAGGDGLLAIVNPIAAERYGLEVVARDIADRPTNTTRFVVLGTHVPPPTGWDKTSLVVFIEANRPGALLQLLEIFAERELNLTKIESRPTKAELGEYCFFLDVEGHLAAEREDIRSGHRRDVRRCRGALEGRARSGLRVLPLAVRQCRGQEGWRVLYAPADRPPDRRGELWRRP
jgi:prephenate dehydratase